MNCPCCGRDGFVRSVIEEEFLKHSVMLSEIQKRLDKIEKKLEIER